VPTRRESLGWLPDIPDLRDYNPKTPEIEAKLRLVGAEEADEITLPTSVDLREWCSPVEDQFDLGSCTANAGTGLIEFFQRKAFGKHIDASRLFLYKTTRNLMGVTGDTGAYLRSTMKAMVLFGTPPESIVPYRIADFEKEPTSFHYSYASNYQALEYYRLDPPGTTAEDLLQRIWTNLAAGLPSMFGFSVYSSIEQASETGMIPYPSENDSMDGGHAVVAVGYDDDIEIEHEYAGFTSVGAFLIRNSWGVDWGDNGYGWLPYDYVTYGLADDWWSLISSEWIDTGAFGID
jgi:C1A family cysteine protease